MSFRSPKLPLLLLLCGLSLAVLRAQISIAVVDELGEPMYGVNAYTEDFSFTASSDLDGVLTLKPLRATTLVTFSFTGYRTERLRYMDLARLGGPLTLKPSAVQLAAAVVVGRTDVVARELPWTVAVVTDDDIAATHPQTSADALEGSGEVYVQRSQMGGGSPIVRGFEANRVLLVVDGVRLNNAVYRSGHLQSAITVDPAMLERAEVIFGAGSLMYGSDALGGVVHFRTRAPRLATDAAERSSGNYFARFSSANLEKTVHVDYNLGHERWASQTSVSVSSFDDLRAGARYNHGYTEFGQRPFFVSPSRKAGEVRSNSDPFVQRGTGYDQIDLLQKLKWQLGRDRYLLANVQFSNSTEVPRYDRLTEVDGDRPSDLKYAEWYYGPQRRVLGSLTYVSTVPRAAHDRIRYIAAYQRIDEDRYDRRLDATWRNFSLVDVGVLSGTVDADKYLGAGNRHRLSYGAEGQYNDVASLGGRVHVGNERVLLDRMSRYPSGGSRMSSVGAYTTYATSLIDSALHLQAGYRFTHVELAADFDADDVVAWPQDLLDGVTTANRASTVALGATYELSRTTRVQAVGSTAFRSPNVDDFGAMRIKNGFVTVPNIDLRPERARNAELTLTQEFGEPGGGTGFAGRLSATGFASRIEDVIVRAKGALPDGDTLFASGETAYRVQVKTNADRGEIIGLGARADLNYGERLRFAARATYTRGTSFDAAGAATPLAHIPPLYGQAKLTYRRGPMSYTGSYEFNGAKAWADYAPEGSSDNEDKAIFGVGTPAWSTLNAYVDARLGSKLSLQGGVENLLDLHYRTFASGVSAPGRNFILSLRGKF